MSRSKSPGSRPASGPATMPPGSASASPAPGAAWVWARGAFLVASGVALYLSYASYAGGGVAGCGAEGGCSEVLGSRWSKWLGLPVSLPAAGLYLALLALTFRVGRPTPRPMPAWATPERLLAIGSWTVWGSAAWFLGLSVFALGKFCPYCLTVHLSGSVGAWLVLRGLPAVAGSRASGWALAPWALLPVGLLVAGQLAFAPKTFRVGGMAVAPAVVPTNAPKAAVLPPPVAPATRTPAPAASASVPAPRPSAARLLSVHGGKFQLNAADLPILGSPTAPRLMVSQFDYTCDHCRRSHGPISRAQRAFSNQLAVISLPMPLDNRCNEWVRRSGHNGCQLAALALGVWRADPSRFPEFDDWMMTSPDGLKVPLALARARSLVGEAALDTAIADPWVANTLQLSVALFRENWVTVGRSSMPMLIVGTNIVNGTVQEADLYPLLEGALGLRRDP